MGACLGTRRNGSASNHVSEETSTVRGSTSAKNLPLKHEKIRWKSDSPLTESQIYRKREEFWDTAPAFEGRKEIWDALKAGAVAVENQDYDLAQAIIDGASITLPNGTLLDCYDELGTRYQLPVYCFSLPLNILQTNSEKEDGNSVKDDVGEEITVKIRLSTNNKDVKLPLRSTDTVSLAKKKLEAQENLGICRQRWFYMGKLISDRQRVSESCTNLSYIIQCIITENSITPVET